MPEEGEVEVGATSSLAADAGVTGSADVSGGRASGKKLSRKNSANEGAGAEMSRFPQGGLSPVEDRLFTGFSQQH